jgi:LPS-assembly lipoprotein
MSRRTAVQAGVLASVLALTGCGFRPVYAPQESGDSRANEQLSMVRIEPLRDRSGQQLHNFLRDQLNPNGQPVDPHYKLQIKLSQRTEKLAFREDETATRANIIIKTAFVLRAADDDRVLYAGRASSINSYNILDEQYPTNVSADDALRRGLREVSQDIKLRLAVYFQTAEGRDL